MTSQFIWWTLFLAETVTRCSAGGSIEKNGLLISSKIEIKQGAAGLAGELTHHGALFGRNFFGETIEKTMYYTKRSLCNGQIPDTPDYIKQNGYFLLVDRGECSFVEKVRNAQRDGATAVFIADDRCLCSADGLCDTDVDKVCEKFEPVMDDDGSGSDIKIPSMLLLKSDSDILRDTIISGSVIETIISFPVPKAIDGRTEYMLFTSPDDRASHQFLDSFLEAALSFGTKAVFQPRMLLTDGTQKGCRQYDDSHVPCKGYCTNYGRYCEPPSVFDKAHYEDKGTKMIVESMRRTCIWNIYGKVDGVGKEWWAYIQLWTLQCSFSQYSTTCAESIYAVTGVDKEEVEICMENSGSFREDVMNTLMETSLSDITKYQVKFAPTLVVNGAVINGALTFGNAMNAVCSTFENSERPKICDKWDTCSGVCSNDETCILWGDNQECSEYRAPYLSNEGKLFDDDYLSLEVDGATTVPLEPSTVYFLPSTEIATKPEIKDNSNNIEDQTDLAFGTKNKSFMDQSKNDLTVNKIESSIPPIASDSFHTADTSEFMDKESMYSGDGQHYSNTDDTSELMNKESVYTDDGQHEFIETIQIYEGSSSDLVIGLGIGFGSALILLVIWLLISKERERRVEDLIASGRKSGRTPRSGLFKSRQRYYNHYSSQSRSSRESDDEFSDEDQLPDEEDYYNDGGEVINYHASRYCHSTRRERDRLFPKSSKRKSRMRRYRERSSRNFSSELSRKEIPRGKRGVEEFPSEFENNSERKSRILSEGNYNDDDDENDNENNNADHCINATYP